MRSLYLGLRPKDKSVIHFPLIQIVPKSTSELKEPFQKITLATHILFTSQSAVDIFFATLQELNLKIGSQIFLAVGSETKKCIERHGFQVAFTPEEETAEGLVSILETLNLKDAFLFWPHSALSRPVLSDYLEKREIPFQSCILYDTKPHLSGPIPPADEIIFTSPSTVHAYIHFFGKLPQDKKLTAIGPITKKTLMQSLSI